MLKAVLLLAFLSITVLGLPVNRDPSQLRKDPDDNKKLEDLIRERGYPLEKYDTVTDDQYILELWRIPHGRSGKTGGPRPVVFLQHGLEDSCEGWVSNAANESLAYLLADAGYDVFLGNSRGATYGLRHKLYNTTDPRFWDFSWDELAAFDMPAQTAQAFAVSGAKRFAAYIGHSQGTLIGFAAFPLLPDLASRIDLFVALAPVAYVHHQRGAILNILAGLHTATMILDFLKLQVFPPAQGAIHDLLPWLCDHIPTTCDDIMGLIAGPDTGYSNSTHEQVVFGYVPAGTSTRNMIHWSQSVRSELFARYDYGCERPGVKGHCANLDRYGQDTPPRYLPGHLNVDVALFSGAADYLADPTDVAQLVSELPPSRIVHQADVNFNHFDFIWSPDATPLVYKDVLSLVAKHRKQ